MAEIGSSYIAFPDLIICGVAVALFYCLTTLPPNSLICSGWDASGVWPVPVERQ
jgi:hypothetical protein